VSERALPMFWVQIKEKTDIPRGTGTSFHQLTCDFYTVGEIQGHTLKGIGMTLGTSSNLDATTARYVDVRIDRKKDVLNAYHGAIQPSKEKAISKEKKADKRK